MKTTNILDSLSLKLLSSRQTIRIGVTDDIMYYFKFDGICVLIYRIDVLIFSKKLSAPVVMQQDIKDCLERAFFWLDYDDMKEIYEIDHEPESMVMDDYYNDWKNHRLF